VELRQLRGVEAVARHRHFTRAADELHLAQSALSHQIRLLERELGTPLFERTSRRVRVTEAGEAIVVRARRILAEVEGARHDIDELRGVVRGRIWVGPLLPAGDLDVAGLLAGFSLDHPGVEVALREGVASDMLSLLAADELDVAFCLVAGVISEEFAVEPMSREEVVLAYAPDQAPSANRIGMAELRRRPLVAPRRGSAIASVIERLFADAGEPLQLTLESGDPFLLRALAARGFAVAVLPRSLTLLDGPDIEVRPFDPPVHLPVALVWRRDRALSPAARTFVRFATGTDPAR
jgi:LysR family transcriptional regulator, transcription activator of glutamate synthase operon